MIGPSLGTARALGATTCLSAGRNWQAREGGVEKQNEQKKLNLELEIEELENQIDPISLCECDSRSIE